MEDRRRCIRSHGEGINRLGFSQIAVFPRIYFIADKFWDFGKGLVVEIPTLTTYWFLMNTPNFVGNRVKRLWIQFRVLFHLIHNRKGLVITFTLYAENSIFPRNFPLLFVKCRKWSCISIVFLWLHRRVLKSRLGKSCNLMKWLLSREHRSSSRKSRRPAAFESWMTSISINLNSFFCCEPRVVLPYKSRYTANCRTPKP